jgi:hypothetical protein
MISDIIGYVMRLIMPLGASKTAHNGFSDSNQGLGSQGDK